jgi:hypothetical protein
VLVLRLNYLILNDLAELKTDCPSSDRWRAARFFVSELALAGEVTPIRVGEQSRLPSLGELLPALLVKSEQRSQTLVLRS